MRYDGGAQKIVYVRASQMGVVVSPQGAFSIIRALDNLQRDVDRPVRAAAELWSQLVVPSGRFRLNSSLENRDLSSTNEAPIDCRTFVCTINCFAQMPSRTLPTALATTAQSHRILRGDTVRLSQSISASAMCAWPLKNDMSAHAPNLPIS